MSEVKFNTPLRFENQPSKTCRQTLVEWVDSYFYLGGRTVQVIDSSTNNLKIEMANPPSAPSLITTSLKIISYFTLALPLLMLLAQTLLRCGYSFHPIEAPLAPPTSSNNYTLELPYDPDHVASPPATLDSLDISTLGLNLDETCQVSLEKNFHEDSHSFVKKHVKKPFTLRQAVLDVIAKIKEVAKDGQKNDILLSTQAPWIRKGSNLFFYDQYCGEPNKPWLDRILQALQSKGCIQIKWHDGHGYHIALNVQNIRHAEHNNE